MRRILGFTALAVALCAPAAGAIGIGVEPYGGFSYPAVQDDRGSGPVWGLRVPVNLVPLLTIEPYYSSASYADKTLDTIAGPVTIDGGTVKSWGANLLLETGSPELKFYPYLGIGSNTDNRASTGDVTNTGYTFGLGLGVGLPFKLTLDARAEAQMIVNGDVSRKFGNGTVGVAYHFLSLP